MNAISFLHLAGQQIGDALYRKHYNLCPNPHPLLLPDPSPARLITIVPLSRPFRLVKLSGPLPPRPSWLCRCSLSPLHLAFFPAVPCVPSLHVRPSSRVSHVRARTHAYFHFDFKRHRLPCHSTSRKVQTKADCPFQRVSSFLSFFVLTSPRSRVAFAQHHPRATMTTSIDSRPLKRTRHALSTLSLLPLPAFMGASLPPVHHLWHIRQSLSAMFSGTLATVYYCCMLVTVSASRCLAFFPFPDRSSRYQECNGGSGRVRSTSESSRRSTHCYRYPRQNYVTK